MNSDGTTTIIWSRLNEIRIPARLERDSNKRQGSSGLALHDAGRRSAVHHSEPAAIAERETNNRGAQWQSLFDRLLQLHYEWLLGYEVCL